MQTDVCVDPLLVPIRKHLPAARTALGLFKDLSYRVPHGKLEHILRLAAIQGHAGCATLVVQLMKEAGFAPSTGDLSARVFALARGNDLDAAVKAVQDMSRHGKKIDGLALQEVAFAINRRWKTMLTENVQAMLE